MEHFQADLALLHTKQVEQRVADQYVRVEPLRRIGAPTELAEDSLRTLHDSLAEKHLAHITGHGRSSPLPTDLLCGPRHPGFGRARA